MIPKWSHEDSYTRDVAMTIAVVKEETGSCLLFNCAKLNWTEVLNCSAQCWTEANWSEVIWWEQVSFKYRLSRSTGQLFNWVITYHETPAPNESRTTVLLKIGLSLSNFSLAPTYHQSNWTVSIRIDASRERPWHLGASTSPSLFALLQPVPFHPYQGGLLLYGPEAIM